MGLRILDVWIMVKTVKGDLFQADEILLAHGVNCKGAFGSGVALGMLQKHVKARESYFDKHYNGCWKLGEVQFVASGNKIIANCATQKNFLPRGKCHADYNAIKICMRKVKDYARLRNLTVAIPKIGAGLAGGDWKLIEDILNDVFVDYDIVVYSLD
jgi:O-acetyl-ADP-ribose deacetylase (regulator of RNase III)